MDKGTLIVVNGLLFTVFLPILAFAFPKLFTFLRFIKESSLESIMEEERKRVAYQLELSRLNALEENTTVAEEELVEEVTDDSVIADTIAALVSTGFKKRDAEKAVKRVAYTKNFSSVEDLLITTLDRSNT
jgi:Holliday junction resolvasome RuvABC DNA-binding subunit